ncbi:DUF5134 domain-containing protein [Streptomyces sp. P9(2023)]|uniref:DUF5134 domain-containing protein n=1 Tax=Streptomyces sp. P9(2023) TaxID=3064394 RepID=UPI0028F430CB|nr:DUF5134 domain-containing protein [Streptomyces sp. P9(2023)]MDT9687485.1 DUF5134 domain-containing protein [Streptomyces sp. P9(2023)]
MHGPTLTAWLLLTLCGASTLYCLLRSRRCVGEERRTAAGEAVMGIGMTAMALPAAVLSPPSWSWGVYAAVFGVAALHALVSLRHGGHHPHHLVGSLAMVYMAWPGHGAAHGGHGGGGGGGALPLVTGALLVYYAAYVLRSGARLVPVAGQMAGQVAVAGPRAAVGPAWVVRPEFTLVCRLSMALAMLAMLVAL